MTYMLNIIKNGHQIHLGFREGKLFIRALVNNTVLEYIPPEVFGKPSHFDLPASLVEGCVHWLNMSTGMVEMRQKSNIWGSKESNWVLDFYNRRAYRRRSTLVDPQSTLFHRITKQFSYFEFNQHLTVFQPEKGTLTVELRRLELSFFVNHRNLLESRQLRSEIDPDQDA